MEDMRLAIGRHADAPFLDTAYGQMAVDPIMIEFAPVDEELTVPFRSDSPEFHCLVACQLGVRDCSMRDEGAEAQPVFKISENPAAGYPMLITRQGAPGRLSELPLELCLGVGNARGAAADVDKRKNGP